MTRFSMKYGTQTRKSSSGQPFDEEYQMWLSGYWEDFTSSYSLPEAVSNKLSSTDTHFGNPMNCEARLNPHYRWSYPDRIATYSGSVIYQGKVTNDINLLHNLSMAEWLSIDPTRLGKGRDFVSKINNEYLDSHAHSNRYRFGGKGELDNYISMTPSYASGGKYLINNGDIDVSYGRSGAVKYGFDANAGQPTGRGSYYVSSMYSGQESWVDVDVSTQFNETGDDIRIYHTASAVTCGVFSTDTSPSDILTISSWNADQSPVETLGAEIKSPSRTPFLAVRHTMPATNRLEGKLTADGEWEYTGAKRQLVGLRVGDTIQVGKDDHFCVIQEINTSTNKITKLYSLSNNALIDRDKYVSSHASYLGSGANPDNVDIRKWFEPVITYNGDLNCVGDGDTFHLRFCPLVINNKGLPDADRVAHYILRVGYDSSRLNITSNGNRYDLINADYQPSHSIAAIEIDLQLHPTTEGNRIQKDANQVRISALDSSIATDHQQAFIDYDNSGTVTAPNYTNEWEHWVDVDVVMDFTNQRYKVYIDGYEAGTFNFETKPSGGAWAASDLYGWHMDHAALQKDGRYGPDGSADEHSMVAGKYWGPAARRTSTLYTLIDRVGIVNEITNPVRNSPNGIVAASDLGIQQVKYRQDLNSVSSMEITVYDDDNERQIQDIFSSTPSEWMLLFFKNGIDSTYWTGFLDKVQVEQKKETKSKTIKITARDSLGRMDGLMPYWEVGQNETGPTSTSYTYRREEAQAVNDNFYLGARALLRGSESIGMDHQTRATHPQASTTEIGAVQGYYAARYDQRTRLYSANPIQMYVGGVSFGPSVEMDSFNTSPQPKIAIKTFGECGIREKL